MARRAIVMLSVAVSSLLATGVPASASRHATRAELQSLAHLARMPSHCFGTLVSTRPPGWARLTFNFPVNRSGCPPYGQAWIIVRRTGTGWRGVEQGPIDPGFCGRRGYSEKVPAAVETDLRLCFAAPLWAWNRCPRRFSARANGVARVWGIPCARAQDIARRGFVRRDGRWQTRTGGFQCTRRRNAGSRRWIYTCRRNHLTEGLSQQVNARAPTD